MKNGFNIDWSNEALDNLDSILKYLQENWTEREINRFVRKLNNRIELLSKSPLVFPAIDSRINIRRSVLTEQTTIYYEIKNDVLIILSLFNTLKDPDSLYLVKNEE